jgi:hypothetical protein
MKIARTIWSHLGLLRELAVLKWRGKSTPAAAAPRAVDSGRTPVPRDTIVKP